MDIATLMGLMADAVEAGKTKAVGVSNYSAAQLRTATRPWLSAAFHWRPIRSSTPCCTGDRDQWGAGYLPRARHHLDRLPAARKRRADWKVLDGSRPVGIRRFREPFRGSKFHALKPTVTLLRLIGDRYGKTQVRWRCDGCSSSRTSYRFPARRMPSRQRITPGPYRSR